LEKLRKQKEKTEHTCIRRPADLQRDAEATHINVENSLSS